MFLSYYTWRFYNSTKFESNRSLKKAHCPKPILRTTGQKQNKIFLYLMIKCLPTVCRKFSDFGSPYCSTLVFDLNQEYLTTFTLESFWNYWIVVEESVSKVVIHFCMQTSTSWKNFEISDFRLGKTKIASSLNFNSSLVVVPTVELTALLGKRGRGASHGADGCGPCSGLVPNLVVIDDKPANWERSELY